MPNVVVIGGGFIGQLIHVLIPSARILDWRKSAPSAQSRSLGPQYLWEQVPELPCRGFNVYTRIDGLEATADSMARYKRKVGKSDDKSDWSRQFQHVMSGYECTLPPTRVEYGRRILRVRTWNHSVELVNHEVIEYDLLISTIPLYALSQMIDHDLLDLYHQPIYIDVRPFEMIADPHLYVNYISNPRTAIYRQTLRKGSLHTESLDASLGFSFRLTPGKIYPDPRVSDYLYTLCKQGVYCFGRFATWNPEELAHETIQQVRKAVAEWHL